MLRHHDPLPTTHVTRMESNLLDALEEGDVVSVNAGRESEANKMAGHRVAVGGDVDQTFAVDHHSVKDAVVVSDDRQGIECRAVPERERDGELLSGVGEAQMVDLVEPGGALLERDPGRRRRSVLQGSCP